jgi:protein-tyrosine-phosphatase
MAQAAALARYPGRISAKSCGLLDLRMPASAEAIAITRKRYGIDLRVHLSRDVRTVDASEFNYVIAMTPRISAELIRVHDVSEDRIVTWDVPDPVGEGMHAYERALNLIEKNLDAFTRNNGVC